MVFEYIHRISLFEVGSYLRRYLDDHATVPLGIGAMNYTLEAHANFLLCTDMSCSQALRRSLHRYLPTHLAETLMDDIHDQLLAEIRPFMNLDENEEVVEVRVKSNYDATIVVHELDGAHAVTT